jgi:Na+/melibiose symporter-like transporter
MVSLVLFCFYPLNERKMKEIEMALKSRRANAAAAANGG